MIVRLKYDQIKGSVLRGAYNNKEKNMFMLVTGVDETNVVEVVKNVRGNKWVVGVEYSGDLSALEGVNLFGVNVIIYYDIDAVDEGVDAIMQGVGRQIRVVFNVPKDYSDMRTIFEYSLKYPNIRFSGGHFIRVAGCKIGAIGADDIYKKVHHSKVEVVSKGEASIFPVIDFNDLAVVEFSENGGREKVSGGRKKALSSLLTLAQLSDKDRF